MAETDGLLEMFVFENTQLLEQLEDMLLGGEKNSMLSREQIDETFRVMHTIKGSSAMMSFDGMAHLAHAVEDLFSKIREKEPRDSEWSVIFDSVLEAIDFFKEEISKIQDSRDPDGEAEDLTEELHRILARLISDDLEDDNEAFFEKESVEEYAEEPTETSIYSDKEELPVVEASDTSVDRFYYKAKLFFDKGCQMETIRAFGILMSVKELLLGEVHVPADIDSNCDEEIAATGFTIYFCAPGDNGNVVRDKLEQTMFLAGMDFEEISEEDYLDVGGEGVGAEVEVSLEIDEEKPVVVKEKEIFDLEEAPKLEKAVKQPVVEKPVTQKKPEKPKDSSGDNSDVSDKSVKQSFISVNVNKIDKLMNLVGEIVTTESMVTKNPDIVGLNLENFEKQARMLRKLTNELQDIVMSVRMIPISTTFHKMQRIIRDMCKKVGKQAELVLIGEETEVDKNINDHLSDPLMHLIRNAMDHGLEKPDERALKGKSPVGKITLEAKNSGGDVIVRISDDGKGLDREKIVKKAIDKGLTTKSESEISDKEAFGFILAPGFSTNDQVTEFSGRGVGMDVVCKNLDAIGGNIVVDSEPGKGTSFVMHIPLTLAIMDGMNITVGDSMYIVPTLAIRESLEPRLHKIITEPNGNEMIMIRGDCYPIIRLHRRFDVEPYAKTFNDGIMIIVESEAGSACLFADKLIGEQQAVVKPMPLYITKNIGRIKGITGCSIMGDGSISLILDINSLLV